MDFRGASGFSPARTRFSSVESINSNRDTHNVVYDVLPMLSRQRSRVRIPSTRRAAARIDAECVTCQAYHFTSMPVTRVGTEKSASRKLRRKRFASELSHSASNGLKSYLRLPRALSRIAASLFQNPSDAFRHTCQCVGMVR